MNVSPQSFLIPQVLQSVKFSTWFSKKSLAGSDVYPVYSKDVRTFECFPKNSLGLWGSNVWMKLRSSPLPDVPTISAQCYLPQFLHWTQIVQVGLFPHQRIPNVTSQKHLRGPSALPSGLSPAPPCPRSLWGHPRPHFRSTSLLHHHGCLSEIHTRSCLLAPGGTSKLSICHSWTPRAATQGPSLAPAEPLSLWVFLPLTSCVFDLHLLGWGFSSLKSQLRHYVFMALPDHPRLTNHCLPPALGHTWLLWEYLSWWDSCFFTQLCSPEQGVIWRWSQILN